MVGPDPTNALKEIEVRDIEETADSIPAEAAGVGRRRVRMSIGVGLYLLGQAMILVINGPGGSNQELTAHIARLAMLAMIGGLAIGGRGWARWVIGILAALNALVVGFHTPAAIGTGSGSVIAMTVAALVSLGLSAFLLLFVPRSLGEARSGGTGRGTAVDAA